MSALVEYNSVFATRSPFTLIANSTAVVAHMLIIRFADYLIVPTSVIKFNSLAEMEMDNQHHQLIHNLVLRVTTPCFSPVSCLPTFERTYSLHIRSLRVRTHMFLPT